MGNLRINRVSSRKLIRDELGINGRDGFLRKLGSHDEELVKNWGISSKFFKGTAN
jgi:hypothetical protein